MALRQSTSNNGASGSINTTVPAGVQSGDIVILSATNDYVGYDFASIKPSGFTTLYTSAITTDGQTVWIGWKRLTGADSGSYTFTDAGNPGAWVCQAVALSGRHATNNPVATENIQNTGQTNPVTVTATGVTAVAGDDLVWVSGPDVSATGIGNGHTPPTNYSELQDQENGFSNLSIALRENVSAGATGNISGTFAITSGTSGWVAYLVRVPAAVTNTTFLEPGGDANFGFGLWGTTYISPAIVTDHVNGTHVKSIQFRANNADQVQATGVLQDSGSRVSFYIYLVALPSGSPSVPVLFNVTSGSPSSLFALNITTGGVLQIVDNNGTQIGTNGATLSTGTWYRICVTYTVTDTTHNTIKVFVNGSSSISITNGTISTTGSSRLLFGNTLPDAQLDFRISDIYVDNSNSNTDTGNIWVTAKRPNANGTTNGFTTQIGSGGSGYGTGHSPQVNERANSDTNGWSMVGAGSAVTEEYSIENVSTGDINITGATIVDYMGWVRAKSLASETAQIIVGGANSNISLTSTTAFFTKIAGSTTYPGGNTDIGIITSTTLTTVSLYECGVIVAYIPASVAATVHPFALMGVG